MSSKWSIPAFMVATRGPSLFSAVQTTAQVSGTGTSAIVSLSATGVGNLVVVHIRAQKFGISASVTSVTDDKGNIYQVSSFNESTQNRIWQAYAVQVIGGVTAITINWDDSINYICAADEYKGGQSTNALIFDTNESNNGFGANISVAPFAPATSNELIVATIFTLNFPVSEGANYTLYNGISTDSLRSGYRLQSGATETAPFTVSPVDTWIEQVTAFKLK